jgi:mono/diheme cytochrome c family protein
MARTRFARALPALLCIGAVASAEPQPTVPAGLTEVSPTTAVATPEPRQGLADQDAVRVARGRYLVELIGCGACHTDGAIIGEPNERHLLAGSGVGIAYTSPMRDRYPGVVFAPNLTPDRTTGLGSWTDEQVAAAIRTGARQHGAGRLTVMSWPLYQRMSDEDVAAIVAYLRAIPPVAHKVPAAVAPGTPTRAPYVHFAVYRSP